MAWPQSTDYVEAVQNLALSVRDSELRAGQVVENAVGLPATNCGNFATVFQCGPRRNGSEWALKCFTRRVPNLQPRYQQITQHLDNHARLPFMVRFRYIARGILVHGRWYSVLKMDWVKGLRLDRFLDFFKKNDFQERLQTLCRKWLPLARMLREAGVGHGDLQAPLAEVPFLQQVVLDAEGGDDAEVVPLSREQLTLVENWFRDTGVPFGGNVGNSREIRVSSNEAISGSGEPKSPPERKRRQPSARPGAEPTLEKRLREWLRNGTLPEDHYELLGQARCHPHRKDLFAAVRECNRVLHACQNHPEAQLAERARHLQMQVAEALHTFSNETLWSEYDGTLIGKWREQYARQVGRNRSLWRRQSLRPWLESRRVHPARLEHVMARMVASDEREADQASPPEPKAAPARSFRDIAFPAARETPPVADALPEPAGPSCQAARSPAEGQPGQVPPRIAPPPHEPLPVGEVMRTPGSINDSGALRTPQPEQPIRPPALKSSAKYPSWLWWLVGSAAACVMLCIMMVLLVLTWLLL